jgi:hypothetical protein
MFFFPQSIILLLNVLRPLALLLHVPLLPVLLLPYPFALCPAVMCLDASSFFLSFSAAL